MAKKQIIQVLIERSKYLDDENFLKPIKKKRATQRKSTSKKMRRISDSEYQRLIALTKQKSGSRAVQRGHSSDIPEWAKLARVSTIPNS